MAYNNIIMQTALFAFLCFSLSEAQASTSTLLTHQILIVIPLGDVKESTTGWERGHEILPGAQIATEMINNNPNITYQLQLIPIDSGRCENSVSQFQYLPQLINVTLKQGLSVRLQLDFCAIMSFS